jgi:hypothetical protein
MKRTFIKKGIFTCIAAIIGIASSFAQTITTGTVDASVCAGSTISVPFTTTGTVGTDFKVQLSDASGAFTAPVEIGSGAASPITATIASSTAAGKGYKVRVVTTALAIIGSASTAFIINEKPAAPTGSDFYRLCVGGTPVQLTATGQNLKWYAYDGQGGVNPLSAAPTINPTGSSAPVSPSYYVTQTINGCEGSKLDISVAVSLQTPTPTVTNPAPVCQNSSVTSSILTGAVGSSTNFIWYESLTGPAYTSVPVPSTAIAGTKDYYVSEVASRSCESARAKVTVTVLPAPAAPTVTCPVNYTVGDTPKALPTASGYIWYTSATGGSGTGIAPTPSTATAGTTSYFVGQKSGDCDGPRSEIKVIVTAAAACTPPAAPVVTSPVNVTVGETATLTATAISGATLNWYGTSATGGTATATPPTVSTTAVGTSTYYVSQIIGACESPRSAIVVNVAAAACTTPAAPVVTSPVNVTVGQTVTLAATGISGATLNWYGTSVTGGTATATPPTVSTAAVGTTTYYVSQTVETCESPRSAIVVNVAAASCTTPDAPVVTSPVNVTVGQTVTLAATAITGASLKWYGTSATGGTAIATAPTVSTTAVGTTTYYVSQIVGTCESPRSAIVVNVAAAACTTPAAPVVTSPVNVTVGQTATLTATAITGATLKWYGTSATGGIATTTAPTVSTTAVGSTTYYVSQIIGTCESPRSAIVVNVAAAACTAPAAPVVTSPVNVTVGQTVTLAATAISGATLKWYGTNVSGGTASGTPPTVSTATVGSTTYYVSQAVGTCESPRSAIVVNVAAAACATAAPTVTPSVTYCLNEVSTALTATGTALKWYSAATGGTGSTTALIPSTTAAGTTSYYVSQTLNGCEGPRAKIDVIVNSATPVPVVSSPVTYCLGEKADTLTATGTALKWYTAAMGGTALTSAPVIITVTAGTKYYYVSQTVNGCESLRAEIKVTVNPVTPLPTIPASLPTYCFNGIGNPLTATGTALKWYAAATGGTGSSMAPVPSTTTAGTTSYFVSQTINGCESARAEIKITVKPQLQAPVVASNILEYCQFVTAPVLTATPVSGAALFWYTTPTGGTASAVAPIPSTATAGTISYYVSQTDATGCVSARAKVDVKTNVTDKPIVATSSVAYCQNEAAAPLVATGTNLKWYLTIDDTNPRTSALIPFTEKVSDYSFYVTQTGTNTCESAKAEIKVHIKPLPSAIISGSSSIGLGGTATITINFTGDGPWTYILSNGVTATTNSATVSVPVSPLVTTTYVVTEVSNACGKGIPNGSALVTVQVPTLTIGVPSVSALCAGKTFIVPFQQSGSFPEGSSMRVQISTVNETTKFVSVPSVLSGNVITATIPDTTIKGTYYIRVANIGKDGALVSAGNVSTGQVTVNPLPVATVSGATTIYVGAAANLKVSLTGDAPWTFSVNNGTSDSLVSTSVNPITLRVSPKTTTTYTITAVSNQCGAGRGAGSARIQVDPVLGTEPPVVSADWLKIYPTLIDSKCTVEITSVLAAKDADIEILDLNGRSLYKKSIRQKITEVDFSQRPGGLYLLKVKNGKNSSVQRIFKQ